MALMKVKKDGAWQMVGVQGPQGLKGEQGIQGEVGPEGEKGDTGEKGADGVSCTHSWNGTILSVTSASGTSSADLKGDKGDKGDTGATGPEGPQGPKGDKGDTGATGATGPKGDTGEVDYSRLDAYLPLAGGTMTGELIVNGGDKTGGSKIVLETGKGQITNSQTATLFGYTADGTIAVGHSSCILAMRGSGTRPKYNSNDIALKSDIDSAIESAIGNAIGGSY